MPSGYSLTGVNVQEEGASTGFASTLNFTGAGVTATASGGTVTVNIPGGGAPGPQTSADDQFANGLNFTRVVPGAENAPSA